VVGDFASDAHDKEIEIFSKAASIDGINHVHNTFSPQGFLYPF
jgi:hypothetical protein